MAKLDELCNELFPGNGSGPVVEQVGFFPGERSVTVEQFCEEVLEWLRQIKSGESPPMTHLNENLQQIPLSEFLAQHGGDAR